MMQNLGIRRSVQKCAQKAGWYVLNTKRVVILVQNHKIIAGASICRLCNYINTLSLKFFKI